MFLRVLCIQSLFESQAELLTLSLFVIIVGVFAPNVAFL